MASVCFTGRGVSRTGIFHTREVWEARARQEGHTVHDKVMSGTTFLVAAQSSIDKRVSKVVSAERNGTTVLSYSRWVDFLNGDLLDVDARAPGTRSQLARDIETVARAGSRLAVPDRGSTERIETIHVIRRPTKVEVRNHTCALVIYEGSSADAALLALARHEEARRRPFSNLRTTVRYSEDAAAWFGACGRPVPSTQIDATLPNYRVDTRPRCEPHGFVIDECNSCKEAARLAALKPADHPLGGFRRVLNLGD